METDETTEEEEGTYEEYEVDYTLNVTAKISATSSEQAEAIADALRDHMHFDVGAYWEIEGVDGATDDGFDYTIESTREADARRYAWKQQMAETDDSGADRNS